MLAGVSDLFSFFVPPPCSLCFRGGCLLSVNSPQRHREHGGGHRGSARVCRPYFAIYHLRFIIPSMRYRQFGRTGWQVSEIGYGMWGMGGWSGSDDQESLQSLQAAADRGCTFFDTAHAYGEGHSEQLLGQTVRANPDKRLYTATKVPPKKKQCPAQAESTHQDTNQPDHV